MPPKRRTNGRKERIGENGQGTKKGSETNEENEELKQKPAVKKAKPKKVDKGLPTESIMPKNRKRRSTGVVGKETENKLEADEKGGGENCGVSRRQSHSNKKLKLEPKKQIKKELQNKPSRKKSVLLAENDSEAGSDYSRNSRRSSRVKENVESVKIMADASAAGGDIEVKTEKNPSGSDTNDSEFEEVKENCDEETAELRVTKDTKDEFNEKEVEVMSDSSDDSDFEEVSSKTLPSQNVKGKTPKKQQISKTRKTKSANQSKPDSSATKMKSAKSANQSKPDSSATKIKSTSQSRKRQSKKKTEPGKVKKLKTNLIEEMPSTSALNGIDEDDVTAVLLRMEGASCSQPSSEVQSYRSSEIKGSSLSDSDEGGSDDWEEVEDHKGSPLKSRIPTDPVEITLEAPDFIKKKRKKKKFDWLGYIQQTMRRFQKEVQISMHKVHLLCLLSHGFQQNQICNGDQLKAQVMSLLPSKWIDIESTYTKDSIKQLVKWYREEFPHQTTSQYFTDSETKNGLVKSHQLESAISSRQVHDGRTLATIFLIILRTLGLDVRLVMSFHPIRIKLAEKEKFKVKQKPGEKNEDDPKICDTSPGKEGKKSKSVKKDSKGKKSRKSVQTGKMKKTIKTRETDCSDENGDNSNDKAGKKKDEMELSEGRGKSRGDRVKNKGKSKKGKQLLKKPRPPSDCDSDSDDSVKPQRTLRAKERKKMAENNEDEDVSESGFDEFEPSDSDFSDEEYIVKKKKKRQKSGEKNPADKKDIGRKQKGVGKKKKSLNKESEDVVELSSGDEFTEEETSFRSPLQEKLKRKNRKVLSSDSDGTDSEGMSSCDLWTEVFLPGEQKWICVDCVRNVVDKPYEIESGITQPVHYVLAYTADGSVSDVTARYASQWMSQTRKLRVDPEWWTETLEPYKSQLPEHGDKDEESIRDELMKRPLPTSIGEFKNHPLYALTRHLLKFEAIYPETAIPFGYIRGEPIYARECVHTLHSRENWLKEGRAVRLGEEPYKMVKSRKRWKQPKPDPNILDLELFGHWQTEKYIPPPAVNGKITRNAYGNLELFQPWMLPAGTVHLKGGDVSLALSEFGLQFEITPKPFKDSFAKLLTSGFPALNRVAKKLSLDCVPAMVGWDYHSGFSHPLIDGWVVCEEHKDILIAAWDEDQEIQKQREIEKREKRVLGNWKLLTRSLLIRERLKKRFDLKDAEPEQEVDVKSSEKATDAEQAWPRNREQHKKLSKHVETM